MKVGVALLTQVIFTLGPLASAQNIPEECFGYSAPKGNDKTGKSINNESQVLSSDFSHDMRLKKIITCKGFRDELLGVTFVLSTTTSSPALNLELDSLGYRSGNSCGTTSLKKDEYVSYVEISYDSDRVNSFYAKIGENTNILVGNRKASDKTKGWSFNEKNLLTGLIGTESSDGINSLGTVIYQPACADEARGLTNDPTTGSKTYVSGLLEKNEQGPDGTYRFTDTPMKFENEKLSPTVVAEVSMWSLDNPNLFEDVKAWALETPNLYYVGSGLLLVAISIISCICCCCQACYTPNVAKILDDPDKSGTLPQVVQLSNKKFKVDDVLNEQATCEDIAEMNQPTARRLVSQQDSEVNENIPAAVSSTESLYKERERELKMAADDDRRSLAEQIMYGTSLSRKKTVANERALNDQLTKEDLQHHKLVTSHSIEDRHRLFLDETPPETREPIRVRETLLNTIPQGQPPMAMHLLNRGQSTSHLLSSKKPSPFNMDDGSNYDHRNIQLQNPNYQQQLQLNIGDQQYSQQNNLSQNLGHPPMLHQQTQQSTGPDQKFSHQFLQRSLAVPGYESERLRSYNIRPQATYSSQSVSYVAPGPLQNVVDPYIQDHYQQNSRQNTSQQAPVGDSQPYQQDGYMANPELNHFISFKQTPGQQLPQQRLPLQRHATQDDVINANRLQQHQYGGAIPTPQRLQKNQSQNEYDERLGSQFSEANNFQQLQQQQDRQNISHQHLQTSHHLQQPSYVQEQQAPQSHVSPAKPAQFQQLHQEIQQFQSAQKEAPSFNQSALLSPPQYQLQAAQPQQQQPIIQQQQPIQQQQQHQQQYNPQQQDPQPNQIQPQQHQMQQQQQQQQVQQVQQPAQQQPQIQVQQQPVQQQQQQQQFTQPSPQKQYLSPNQQSSKMSEFRSSSFQQPGQITMQAPPMDNLSRYGQSQNQIPIANINESSINKGSYPETPNTNVLISSHQQQQQTALPAPATNNRVMDRLSSQVIELESKLQHMQKQQTLRELTNEAAKQETQLQQLQQLKALGVISNESSLQTSIIQQHNDSSDDQVSLSQNNIQQQHQQHQQPNTQPTQNMQKPIVVNVRPNIIQQQQEPVAATQGTNIGNFQLPLDNTPTQGRNIGTINAPTAAGQSTYMAATDRLTQADIDEQFKEIPELGGTAAKKSQQEIQEMFNYGQKFSGSALSNQVPSQNTATNTFKTSMNSQQHLKGSIGSSVHNISAVLANEGQPERTDAIASSQVIELNSVAEAGPVSQPQIQTPSPTYFTK